MKTRVLGGLKVSAVGYGCMGLSHGYGAAPEHDEAVRLIRKAYELGCTFFDTAEAYGAGHNECLTGEAIRPFRAQIVLATKLHLNSADGDTEPVIRRHLEESMRSRRYAACRHSERIFHDGKDRRKGRASRL